MWVRFPPGPPSPRKSRLVRLAALSAAIHLAVLLLLVLRLHGSPEPELSPPPADFAMVFQSGSPKAAQSPKPVTPESPPAAPAVAHVQAPPTPPAAPPHVAAKPSPPPAPPAPKPAPAPTAPPPVTTPSVPKPEAPPLPPLQPHPAPKPARIARAPASPPATAPALRPPSRQSRTASAKFPAPMMRSFFIPSTASVASAAHPFSHALSGEPAVQRGMERDNPFDMRGAEQLGSDWSNEFMEWVDEHKHYPEQAAANNEDGNSAVQFTVDRYGRVKEVRLVERSGSVWLDMGLTGMFRDARLPPFPPGTAEKDVTITFTMHYILER